MKTVVLAEKPSVGRDLARVLKCNKKGNGYLENNKYIVTWALGHLVTLADPEKYDDKYKKWSLEDLPILPNRLKLVVIKKTSKQYSVVKSLLLRNDVSLIVIATDAGREGELVARWIIDKVGVKKPLKRLWISSVTDKAIKDGLNNLKDGREYKNLYYSAIARAQADWVVGINATRALTTKYNARLSCGRVQTPTLQMIFKREQEIKNFIPKKFYGINLETNKIKFNWIDSNTKDIKTFNKNKCDNVIRKINNKLCEITDISKSYKKSYAPLLYDLTELQRDANRMYGFSAKETLNTMQGLYEYHKILTYPRTDSRYITTDMVDTLKERVEACGAYPYEKVARQILSNQIKANKSFVDNKKVSDHHAIIPTEQYVDRDDLDESEKKIYDLVVKRFFSVLFPPFEYEQTKITAKIDNEIFITKGKIVKSIGWKQVYNNDFDDEFSGEKILPNVSIGEKLPVNNIIETSGETKPPSRFNEATLLSAMENPSKYMESQNKDLVKTIGETGGLGTVATRADIIEKLFNTFLLEKRANDIHLTSKGKQLLNLVPLDLKSPSLTAKWEQKLSQISKGKLNKDTFISEMKKYAVAAVDEIKDSSVKFKHDNLTSSKCPQCGKYLLKVSGKKGTMLVCQDRECNYRKNISKTTNARCPNCHKKLELVGEGEKQMFTCKCGHRERLSVFKKRKQEKGNEASKNDVKKYMKKQEKDNKKPSNSALADALAKFKIE